MKSWKYLSLKINCSTVYKCPVCVHIDGIDIMDNIGAISIISAVCKQGVIVTQICAVILAVVDFCVAGQESSDSNIT